VFGDPILLVWCHGDVPLSTLSSKGWRSSPFSRLKRGHEGHFAVVHENLVHTLLGRDDFRVTRSVERHIWRVIRNKLRYSPP